MKIKIYEDRSYSRENFSNEGTENENLATTLYFQFPETVNGVETSTLNKYIVFDINGEPNTDILTSNNSYSIPTAITQLGTVSFNIYLVAPTNNGEDSPFRWISKKITLNFNDANDMTEIVITVEEINIFNSLLSELNSAIANIELLEDDFEEFKKDYDELKDDFEEINRNYQAAISQVENVNIDAIKTGSTATITITNKEGIEKTVEIQDGTDYIITQNDYQEIANIVKNDITPLIPTKTSDIINNSGFIDKEVNNLTNYYKKSETYTKTEVDNKVSSVYKYKGTVATYADLPSSDLTIGDVYNVESDDSNYAWNGTAWDKLGGNVDLSNYYTKSQTDTLVNAKYTKPSGGIPKADLTSEVQTSLGKADTAIQNTDYATSNKGGVVKIGGGYGSDILNGALRANEYSYEAYPNVNRNAFISKGTLENVITGKQLINQSTLNESQEEQDEIIQDLKTKNELLSNDHVPITDKDTEIQLSGTGDLPMELVPYGNISQETREGYNELDISNVTTGTTYGLKHELEDDKIKLTGTVTNNGWISMGVSFSLPVGTHTFSYIATGTVPQRPRILNSSFTQQSDTFTVTDATAQYQIAISGTLDDVYNGNIQLQIVEGSTAKDYEKYGVSPSINYPSLAKIVDGEYEIAVENKNKLDISSFTSNTTYGLTFSQSNQILKIKGTKNASGWAAPNFTFTLPVGTYRFSYENTGTMAQRPRILNSSYAQQSDTFTVTDATKQYLIAFSGNSGDVYDCTLKLQIEEGSIASSIITHAEQNITINTSSNPLYSENDCYKYLTSEEATFLGLNTGAGWYAYNEYYKYVFTGNESGGIHNNHRLALNCSFLNMPIPYGSSSNSETAEMYSNIAKAATNNQTWNITDEDIISMCLESDIEKVLYFSLKGLSTLAEYQNALRGNYVIYKLKTPTYTKITDTDLINSLEALKDMQSYYNVTNISQTHSDGQADMKIQANALKSLKAMQSEIDSLDARLTLVED